MGKPGMTRGSKHDKKCHASLTLPIDGALDMQAHLHGHMKAVWYLAQRQDDGVGLWAA